MRGSLTSRCSSPPCWRPSRWSARWCRGSTIILALSALIPGGELSLWVLLSAATGALLGDGSAFWTGHCHQRKILNTWPLTDYPRLVAQSEAFFQRWGTWAVFFARFVPPIRAFVPVTAGALGMPPPRFYAVNIPAILVMGASPCIARGAGDISVLHEYAGIPHHGRAQALLDAGRDRRRAAGLARAMGRSGAGAATARSSRRAWPIRTHRPCAPAPRPGAGPT